MKAYLVQFTLTTRVVVKSDTNPNNDGELFDNAVETAIEQMNRVGIDNYLNAENAEIIEDEDCPAGTFINDKEKAI